MAVLAALQSVHRKDAPPLAARLSALQVQQACHALFMDAMKGVVADFYRLLPATLQASLAMQDESGGQPLTARLQRDLDQLRAQLDHQFTEAYPMHPELRGGLPDTPPGRPSDPIDMDRVDDWIRRTTISQQVVESIGPSFDDFSRHYNSLLYGKGKPVAHPFQPDAVLSILADLIAPLKLNPDGRVFCYELMGKAFEQHAVPLYLAMLDVLGDAPPESMYPPRQVSSLGEWLKLAVPATAPGETDGGTGTEPAAAVRATELAALLGRLADQLGELSLQPPISSPDHPDAGSPAAMLVPGMLARDRIFGRFLPATAGLGDAGTLLQGGLANLDGLALQGLHALMQQPPPIDPGPERLGQASQVRALMLQAQGLLLEYTLNGLTYQAQPAHPAWILVNALDALHQGADDRGQFLDPALHHAVSLAMQWLLGQENPDAALEQMNRLLAKINAQLHEERQSRRSRHLKQLGPLLSGDSLRGSRHPRRQLGPAQPVRHCAAGHSGRTLPHGTGQRAD